MKKFNQNKSFFNREKRLIKFDLLEIELNFSRACNRRCHFCPHSQIDYKNSKYSKGFMSILVLDELLKQLKNKKHIFFEIAGTGEPFLNPEFFKLVKKLDNHCKKTNSFFTIITNGDLLKKDFKKYYLFFKNLSSLYKIKISIYENDSYDFFSRKNISFLEIKDMREGFYRKDLLNNRGGLLEINENKNYNTCYYPFFFALIDYNGDVTLCPHDWVMHNKIGNIFDKNILDLFFNKRINFRQLLAQNKRQKIDYCANCSAPGTLIGEKVLNDYKISNR